MKKILSILLVVVLCVALASCSNSQNDTSDDSDALKKYVDENKEVIAESFGSLEEFGMKVEVEARGKSFVNVYTFLDSFEGEPSEKVDSLATTLESQTDSMKAALATMKAKIPDVESIIVEYVGKDGKVIVSKEFK